MGKEVPEGEIDDGLINFDGGSGVIEDGGHVFGGEGVVGVAAWGREYVESRQVLPTTPSPTITSFRLTGSITTLNYNHITGQAGTAAAILGSVSRIPIKHLLM